jgi:hypothetical protein
MEWKDILGFSVVAALITAAVNQGSTWLLAWRQKKHAAQYDGARLAIALERFSYECAVSISDEATWVASQGSHGDMCLELRELLLPSDVGLKNIKLALVDRLLTLQNDLLRANSLIDRAGVHLTPIDGRSDEAAEQAGLMGYRAHMLSLVLRAKYSKTFKREKLHPWDRVSILKKWHDQKESFYSTHR